MNVGIISSSFFIMPLLINVFDRPEQVVNVLHACPNEYPLDETRQQIRRYFVRTGDGAVCYLPRPPIFHTSSPFLV